MSETVVREQFEVNLYTTLENCWEWPEQNGCGKSADCETRVYRFLPLFNQLH